jgi:hypothetical protein
VDSTGFNVSLNLFELTAFEFSAPVESVGAVRVVNYNHGISFNVLAILLSSSIVYIDPEIPEMFLLRDWYRDQRRHKTFRAVEKKYGIWGEKWEHKWLKDCISRLYSGRKAVMGRKSPKQGTVDNGYYVES